jgi:hypothetical protein
VLSVEENGRLFETGDAEALAELQASLGVEHAVNALPATTFLQRTDEDLVADVVARLTVEPLQLVESDLRVEHSMEVGVSANGYWDELRFPRAGYEPGLRIRYSIPYRGRSTLWHIRPHARIEHTPRGIVSEESDNAGKLELVALANGEEIERQLTATIEEQLSAIRACIAEQTPIIERANKALAVPAAAAVARRRKRLEVLAALQPPDTPPPVSERPTIELVKVPMPTPISPERFLIIDASHFEMILEPIRALGRGLEQDPRVMKPLNEDSIRYLFIIQLNARWGEGTATAETFRKRGKTDIRIGAQDYSAFIAECKIWRGPKTLEEAFRQVFRYTTPRDEHCAIIIFNKKNKYEDLLQTISQLLAAHPRTIEPPKQTAKGEWRLRVSRPDDSNASLTLHVFVFHFALDQ